MTDRYSDPIGRFPRRASDKKKPTPPPAEDKCRIGDKIVTKGGGIVVRECGLTPGYRQGV